MIILDATNKSITATSDVAAATTEPNYVVSYVDVTTTTFTPGAADGVTNGTTPVTIVASPAGSTQRQVKFISINNVDTINHRITIKYVDGVNSRVMINWLLSVGDTLQFDANDGWRLLDVTGAYKSSGFLFQPSKYLRSSIMAANTSTTLSLTSTTSYAVWLGVAGYVSSSVNLLFNVTTLASTITWAEVGIFKGAINLNGNPTLTRLGTADVSGVVNSTGIKNVVVSLTTPLSIGDDVWAVIGDQASVTMVVRAGLADDIQSGRFATLTARPSTVTSPTAWTLAGNTIALPWINGFIN